ncbi:OmpA family protein [Hydrogenobacter hydrogenophilus]|uniref:Peptidoglycan-associated lipoprotein n=1 Tax=Hydrogenobacter hydrogenophilus TaxID=35835 RepID=A0A285NZ93_9AQUI|nr:OmpA family protein [Hydrogenobacter hydrogenophilus]SNZ13226.1 peptidoglycan-associated lipoprotein [Hydrogenobacter hydrogenophilus]
MRKSILLSLALLGSVAFAEESPEKSLDPCGSPKEVYSKYLLDKCYKGYFNAIMESKRKSEEALNKANEALNKVNDLEGRVNKLEGIADDHEKRIRALEGRKVEGVKGEWQLEEVGAVYFDFDKFNIKKSQEKRLDEIVDKIKSDAREVLVVGFADTRGSSKYNFDLSTHRAQMVASYLAKKGVDIGRIRIASYGKEVAKMISPKYAEQRVVRIYFIK